MNTERKKQWLKEKSKDPVFRAKHAENMRKWREKNPEKSKASLLKYFESHKEIVHQRQLAYRRKNRQLVLDHYGGKCACCGERQPEFLALDHVNGGGRAHRKSIGDNTTSVYLWVIKHNFPQDFQILCHNCNMAKSIYGVCPHKTTALPFQNQA